MGRVISAGLTGLLGQFKGRPLLMATPETEVIAFLAHIPACCWQGALFIDSTVVSFYGIRGGPDGINIAMG